MTPEERATNCLVWKTDRNMVEMYVPSNVHVRIAEHIRKAVEDEREACAQYAEDLIANGVSVLSAGEVAQAIRQRE